MITQLFTIHDSKTGIYNKPFHQLNEAEALRTVTNIVNDRTQQPSQNPEDYSLWYLGEYDDNTANVSAIQPPKHIVNLIDLVKPDAK